MTDNYKGATNKIQIIDDENDDIDIVIKLLLLSIPCSALSPSLIGLLIWKALKPLLSQQLNNG